MTEVNTNTSTDPNGYFEDDDYALRMKLGLRDIFYLHETPPDQRECPPWCVHAETGLAHGMHPNRPFRSVHYTELIPIALHLYGGEKMECDTGNGVRTGTLDVKMSQNGATSRPSIRLSLDHFWQGESKTEEILALDVDDAADLIQVLTYFIAQADAADALTEVER